ncbi:hypothetical protein Thimo_1503 [Thioflavicoccus mobilis 8321]|uniref:Uncharacterized protein n=1 Tax=Thioflavicoccus mobilis 8321 TaxID=765912 RepID=L0GYA3_9GAMM|nr:hypothetical protein Thimo_1503 [Thioflavicoccus mobilis 8321]
MQVGVDAGQGHLGPRPAEARIHVPERQPRAVVGEVAEIGLE